MYSKYYQEFCNEVHEVQGSYLFWKIIHNRSANEKELLKALNKTPLSWILIKHSLQVTFFITLGRIFDIDDDAFSIDDLLKCCVEEVDSFSLKSLKQRKMKNSNGKEPDWLNEYMEKAYEPNAKDFNKLRSEVAKHRKVFDEIYKPIRHKLFAHNDKEYIDKSDELWDKTNITELEGIIWFLNDLKGTLFDAYENGRKPELQGRDPGVEFYEKDFGELLNFVKNA